MKNMEKIMYSLGKKTGEGINGFKGGRDFYKRFNIIQSKYEKPCIESSKELQEAGITRDQFNKIKLGNDTNISGYCYSIGYIVSWVLDGIPIKKRS